MLLVKVLERKKVIQLFGIGLLLAPFFNTFTKMSLLSEVPNRWSFEVFYKILIMGSTFNQILYIATLIIGAIMLKGSSRAWKSVLILLGGYIALQIADFGHVRTSWVSWVFFITNILVFLFIADQLVWKIKVPTATARKEIQIKARKKILIYFADRGPWAQLLSISPQGIQVRRLSAPPPDIENRELEIQLQNGLTLRTRFTHHSEQDYFFRYTHLSAEEARSLNQWMQNLSKAA